MYYALLATIAGCALVVARVVQKARKREEARQAQLRG